MIEKIFPPLVLITTLVSHVNADETPATLPIQRLNVDLAVIIAQETLTACRKKGFNIAVTVIDRGGHEQALLRDTLAMPLTITVAKHKAYAAMNFNLPTSQLEDRFTTPFSPGKIDGLVLSAGGLPIAAGGTILGGVGVSGAPSGVIDEECAQAGIDAIIIDLEMAM